MTTLAAPGHLRQPSRAPAPRGPQTRLSRVIMVALLIWLAINWCLLALVGDNRLVDVQTLLLCSFVTVVLSGLLLTGKRSLPVIIPLVLVTFALFLLRVSGYLVDPESLSRNIQFTAGHDDVNRAILFLGLGALAAGLGALLGTALTNATTVTQRRNRFICSPRAYFAVGMIAIALHWAGLFLFGSGSYSNPSDFGIYGYFIRIFSSDLAALLGIVVAGEMWSVMSRKERLMVISPVALYAITLVLSGGRGVLMNLVSYWLSYKVVKHGDYRTNRKDVLRAVFVVLFSAIVIFPLSTSIRAVWNGATPEGRPSSPVDLISQAAEVYADEGDTTTVSAFASRAAGLDRLVRVQAGDKVSFPLSDVRNYVVNRTVPGQPFPETLHQGQRYDVLYKNISPADAKSNYNSEVWYLWGISYAYAGWAGGFVIMFLVWMILAAMYQWLAKLDIRANLPMRVLFVNFVVFAALQNAGFDHLIVTSLFSLLSGAVMLWLMGWRSDVERRRVIEPLPHHRGVL